MATYSYSIETKIPLTPQQQANIRSGGSVPDSVRTAASNAADALARSTFGSSWTPGAVDVAFVQDGNYIKSTSITSPSEVPAASLPPGIAPVEGDVNRLVQAQLPLTPDDTPLVQPPPIPQELTTVVNVDVTTPEPAASITRALTPAPVIETTPVPAAPLAFEPLTVGGRILAPAEFEGAADRLTVNPTVFNEIQPVNTNNDENNNPGNNQEETPARFQADPLELPPGAEPDDPQPTTEPFLLNPNDDPGLPQDNNNISANIDAEDAALGAAMREAQDTKAKLLQAQNQATIAQRYNATTKGDWRVRLRISPGAPVLYNDSSNALLSPLRNTDGVVFPYTPTIQTNYAANYDKYDLIHSNYRGYFYKNSSVGEININGTFTAQDTREATYLLAVIHFFRSVTKMFYGQDLKFRGTPPPLCFLSGFGEMQYNNHPCLVTNFQYNLPNDVDYISVSPNNQGVNMSNRGNQTSSPGLGGIVAIINRLKNAGLPQGASAVYGGTDLGAATQTVNGTGQTTYVPTKLDISITLLPVQTRSQVSQQFSLQKFANGSLLSKGFW